MPVTEQQLIKQTDDWLADVNAHLGKPSTGQDFSWAWKWVSDPSTFVYVVNYGGSFIGKEEVEAAVERSAAVGQTSTLKTRKAHIGVLPGLNIVSTTGTIEFGSELVPGLGKTVDVFSYLYFDDDLKLQRVSAFAPRDVAYRYLEATTKAHGGTVSDPKTEEVARKTLEAIGKPDAVEVLLAGQTEDAQWIENARLIVGKDNIRQALQGWISAGLDSAKPTNLWSASVGPSGKHSVAWSTNHYKLGKAPQGFPITAPQPQRSKANGPLGWMPKARSHASSAWLAPPSSSSNTRSALSCPAMSSGRLYPLLAAAAAVGAAAAFYALRPRKARRFRVAGIHIYPVKSMKGIELAAARTDKYGFELDRNWIVVDAETGKFLTARELPRMVLVETSIEPDHPAGEDDPMRTYDRGGYLVLRAPGADAPCRVRFPRDFSASDPAVVDVWSKPTLGCDEGDEVAAYLSAFLGRQVRLLVKDPRHERSPNKAHLPADAAFDHVPQTAFADGYPYLLATDASLADVSSRLQAREPGHRPLEMSRFRPNIVVACPEPFAEDRWTRMLLGGHEFRGVKKCGRCTVPSVDPATGVQGSEPTKLIMSYRRVDKGNRFEGIFGMNCVSVRTGCWVRVGDEVEVLEERDIAAKSKEETLRFEGGPRPVPTLPVASTTLVPSQ
ncbi:hypothetical protein DFJ74DRAFT_647227 [Hyaloraphidium curvatum]|nr:hypothetical protein DFJ74DRAFT_647227 [Hyaloraphidium curvatum]